MGNKPKGLTIIKDDNVTTAMKVLDQKLQEVNKLSETPWKTSGNLPDFGDIRSEKNIPKLVKAFAMVKDSERMYNDAQQDLELKQVPAFTIGGGNTEDWKHDIKLRIAIVQQHETMEALRKHKEILSKFVSEEEQKANAFAELQQFLSTI